MLCILMWELLLLLRGQVVIGEFDKVCKSRLPLLFQQVDLSLTLIGDVGSLSLSERLLQSQFALQKCDTRFKLSDEFVIVCDSSEGVGDGSLNGLVESLQSTVHLSFERIDPFIQSVRIMTQRRHISFSQISNGLNRLFQLRSLRVAFFQSGTLIFVIVRLPLKLNL